MLKIVKIKFLLPVALLMPFFVFTPAVVRADSALGPAQHFFVDPQYDRLGRTEIFADLAKAGEHAYFYVDEGFWNNLSSFEKNSYLQDIDSLASEFDNNIYPKETAFWGSEPNPGIDNDPKIFILLEDMSRTSGGYFETVNEYPVSMAQNSNQKEMIAVNIGELDSTYIKSFLGHEFQHLISFNQKELLRGISEDTWLNELRSEYTPALLGYDQDSNSAIQNRLQTFIKTPSGSLTDWDNSTQDYSLVALLGRYLTEKYGTGILKDSLQSPYAGIASIDNYLFSHGYQERFADAFGNWLAANYLNDTSSGPLYGYAENILNNFKIEPQEITYLSGEGKVAFSYDMDSWESFWHKIILQNLDSTKALKISSDNPNFKIMYLDNLGHIGMLSATSYISSQNLQNFVLMPINISAGKNTLSLNVEIVDASQVQESLMTGPNILKDGSLIKKAGESEIYILYGKYKRYLNPSVMSIYGLTPDKAVTVDESTFNSYSTSVYIRVLNDKKVYSIWPDGTKHWLNMTGKYFLSSGRDMNAIFTIDKNEFNFYRNGIQIKK